MSKNIEELGVVIAIFIAIAFVMLLIGMYVPLSEADLAAGRP